MGADETRWNGPFQTRRHWDIGLFNAIQSDLACSRMRIYVFVCTYVFLPMYMHLYVCTYVCVSTYMSVTMCLPMCLYLWVSTYVCNCVYLCLYICVSTYVCVRSRSSWNHSSETIAACKSHFNYANSGLFLLIFSFEILFYGIVVDFSRIRTGIVRVEGENSDLLTTTTSHLSLVHGAIWLLYLMVADWPDRHMIAWSSVWIPIPLRS